jgi:hypothetical protein
MRRYVVLLAIAPLAANDDLFLNGLWPVLERAQCSICHNDNGVASTTRLQFPPPGANENVVRNFGLNLARLVDRVAPAQSLLLNKPTNRVTHGGGEKIRPGTDDEHALRAWVDYLATARAPAASADAPARATKAVLRRLTHSQYNHTVQDLLGDRTNPASHFLKEDFVHGFTNQAEGQSVSPLLAEAYQRAAERLARNAFRGGNRALIPCDPSPSCAATFIRTFGRRAFRRPLADHEVARYERLFATQAKFLDGAQLVVEAMLVSPNFLFLLAPDS